MRTSLIKIATFFKSEHEKKNPMVMSCFGVKIMNKKFYQPKIIYKLL